MERILDELVERLHKAHGPRLVAVILYGSAASEDNTDRLSDFNVLSVLAGVTPADLAAAEPVFRWWRQMKNPAPLLLSEEEVRTSTDCFAIEFTDIKERRRVLYGRDVIDGIEIDYSFYRAQVEHELRAKLLRLRQKAGGVVSESDLLLRLMADSVSTFCVLFRHAIVLGGGHPKFDKREVIMATQQQFGVDPAPFHTLLDARDQKIKTRDVQPARLFPEYLKQIQVVVDAVDRMEK
jgi:predicted nucleotidyltransferase